MCYRINLVKITTQQQYSLSSVLGECKLLTDYDNYQWKVERYPGEEMYLDELRKIIAQLEVKLKLKADCLKREILDIQEKKMKSSYEHHF